MLNSLDLFSGIGGITLALHGIATPVAYCEVDCVPQSILARNVSKGRLPNAPIISDVRDVSISVLRKFGVTNVDLVVGGFPCVGFSTAGQRDGFDEEQSSLFWSIIDIVKGLKPSMVFLENVPSVLNLGMGTVLKSFHKLGYDCRWTVLPAWAVGAMHQRKRWFMLAIKRKATLPETLSAGKYKPYNWKQRRAPPRMTLDVGPCRAQRCATLGNAVVPDCVRLAFMRLASLDPSISLRSPSIPIVRCIHPDMLTSKRSMSIGSNNKEYPRSGAMCSGTIVPLCSLGQTGHKPDLHIKLNPNAFSSTSPPSPSRSSPRIRKEIELPMWPTPRKGVVSASNILSYRGLRDLPNTVRFAKGTPTTLRKGQVSAEFCEYLMGFPVGWTKYGNMPNQDCKKII